MIDATLSPYSADKTGVSDATSAINTALATGKSVYLPEGKYRIDGTLTVNASGQTLCGDGPSTLLTKLSTLGDVIRVGDHVSSVTDATISNQVIRDLSIQTDNTSTWAINAARTRNLRIVRVHASAESSAGGAVRLHLCWAAGVLQSVFGSINGVGVLVGDSCFGTHIIGNRIDGNPTGTGSTSVGATDPTEDPSGPTVPTGPIAPAPFVAPIGDAIRVLCLGVTIQGNTIGRMANGVNLNDCYGATVISGCYFESCTRGVTGLFQQIKGLQIAGNYFSHPIENAVCAIDLSNAVGVVIDGNQFLGTDSEYSISAPIRLTWAGVGNSRIGPNFYQTTLPVFSAKGSPAVNEMNPTNVVFDDNVRIGNSPIVAGVQGAMQPENTLFGGVNVTGSGATATLGGVHGSSTQGPISQGQLGWARALDSSGDEIWIPYWK